MFGPSEPRVDEKVHPYYKEGEIDLGRIKDWKGSPPLFLLQEKEPG